MCRRGESGQGRVRGGQEGDGVCGAWQALHGRVVLGDEFEVEERPFGRFRASGWSLPLAFWVDSFVQLHRRHGSEVSCAAVSAAPPAGHVMLAANFAAFLS
jgi:hypothetical protein